MCSYCSAKLPPRLPLLSLTFAHLSLQAQECTLPPLSPPVKSANRCCVLLTRTSPGRLHPVNLYLRSTDPVEPSQHPASTSQLLTKSDLTHCVTNPDSTTPRPLTQIRFNSVRFLMCSYSTLLPTSYPPIRLAYQPTPRQAQVDTLPPLDSSVKSKSVRVQQCPRGAKDRRGWVRRTTAYAAHPTGQSYRLIMGR